MDREHTGNVPTIVHSGQESCLWCKEPRHSASEFGTRSGPKTLLLALRVLHLEKKESELFCSPSAVFGAALT